MLRTTLTVACVFLGCMPPVTSGEGDAAVLLDAGQLVDGGTVSPDGGLSDGGLSDGGLPGADAGWLTGAAIGALARLPPLVICQPQAQPFVMKTEAGSDTTFFHACAARCADWRQCTRETTVRGVSQLELEFVVDEDGQGNGFGGTLRFTKTGARNRIVMFHKGGSGTEWVDDFLPGKVEQAGGVALQPKWIQQGPGWFSRPHMGSRLERNLFGVSQRPAAVMKWAALELAEGPLSTMGCSGGSIATYHPRHWHGLDPILRYQLLMGGPVMSKIEAGCRGGASFVGRCTLTPALECQTNATCGATGGTCSPYEWSGGLVMTAVRGTIDHLHANEVAGSNDCVRRRAQPAFGASDFDSPAHAFDVANEHPIDFVMNAGGMTSSDDGLNVLASGAAVAASLQGPMRWNVTLSGAHCDALTAESTWQLLRVGSGLP